MECGDLTGFGRRSEAWASRRTPTCPALSGSCYLGNKGAARRDAQSLNVFERTEVVR